MQANDAGCRFLARYSADMDNTNATGFTKGQLITRAEFRQILAVGSESSPTRIVQCAGPVRPTEPRISCCESQAGGYYDVDTCAGDSLIKRMGSA